MTTAKYTLLEMTQFILSSLDSDEVTDIDDTVESKQVVDVIETTYWDIISKNSLPEHFDFFSLTETSASTPTIMTLPTASLDLAWIKYNQQLSTETAVNYQEVTFQPMDTFLSRMYALNGDESTVTSYSYTVGSDPFTLMALNDRPPLYFTTPDDTTIIFDSFDSDEDTFLQASKTMVYGQKLPVFTRSNSFICDLDTKQFSLLFNEAKSQAFAELKQVTNAKAEQRARKAWITSQPTKRAITTPRSELDRAPNYGRIARNWSVLTPRNRNGT